MKKILIVGGDPNSINSEIIYKSWIKLPKSIKKKIYIISNYNLLKKQFKILNYSINIVKVKNIYESEKSFDLKLINIDLRFNNPFNVSKKNASQFVLKSLNMAHKLALKKNVAGIVNCAIDKNLLIKEKIGVTEYLANKCNLKDDTYAMLIWNKKLSVCPITTHINLKEVSRIITKAKIIKKIRTINDWYKYFKKRPKFCILGLNPHNAEFRRNSEEKKIILPAVKKLNKLGINVKGPLPADNFFVKDFINYDVIVGMYHDQVLTPFKTLFKFDAINITVGLKYLRTSPDHGTAINIIKKKKSNAISLLKCINFINKFTK